MAKPETLKRVLKEQNIDENVVNKINSGFGSVTDKSSKKKKAEYLFHAVNEMERSLEKDTCQRILESCACTTNGSGLEKNIKQFVEKTKGLSLKEKIKKLCENKHMGNPVLMKDGTIMVGPCANFPNNENGIYSCLCPQISGVDIEKPKSHTYCLCCVGQFKFQYENALEKKIDVEIKSSPFKSNGKKPCTFILSIID
jgi:hypothetical protein